MHNTHDVFMRARPMILMIIGVVVISNLVHYTNDIGGVYCFSLSAFRP
jgi:hypothetical protein